VQAGGGRCDGPGTAANGRVWGGVGGLVAVAVEVVGDAEVLGLAGGENVGGEGGLAEPREDGEVGIGGVEAVDGDEPGAGLVGGFLDQLELDAGADDDSDIALEMAAAEVDEPAAGSGRALGGSEVQARNLAAGFFAVALEAGGDDAGVVDDQEVALAEAGRKAADGVVFEDGGVGARGDEEARGVARLGGGGRDQLGGEREVEFGGAEQGSPRAPGQGAGRPRGQLEKIDATDIRSETSPKAARSRRRGQPSISASLDHRP
jgi:hypothetical protein